MLWINLKNSWNPKSRNPSQEKEKGRRLQSKAFLNSASFQILSESRWMKLALLKLINDLRYNLRILSFLISMQTDQAQHVHISYPKRTFLKSNNKNSQNLKKFQMKLSNKSLKEKSSNEATKTLLNLEFGRRNIR